ncbi:TonB-dependent receptor domain-containing protein [Stagnihabitans tardus]|uniref:TonB-dependent receptor n=1 Tax=Stagnihabitans tardus TaxID=2699202 RepID=A0AAE5BRE7_9RHOB|nr:TonB-dependent receptor [Stagnihabitans tardus]NBZ86465.1 TonB-dependent receptor [Stagnihabitans tardus]
MKRLPLTASVAFLALCTPLQAQETGAFQLLGRLIFGAGATKLALDTPQSVTALEAGDFDRSQPETLSDLFRAVPGVTVTGASARALGQSFNIRGVGNAEQASAEERIKVSVDGAPKFFEQYRMGSFFGDLDLYKRVEVLRGPAASTLNGSGAIGGAVNFTTKDAADFLAEGDGRAVRPSLSYGSNGDSLRKGVIFAQRAGNMEFLGAVNQSSGGVVVDGNGTAIAGTAHESWSALAKAKLTLAEGQTLTFAYSQTDTDLKGALVAQTGGAAASGFGTADIAARDTTATLTWANSVPENDLLDLTVTLSRTETEVTKDNFSMGAMCGAGSLQVLCDGQFSYATTALKAENRIALAAGSVILGAQLSSQERTATSSLGAMGFHPEGTDDKLGLYAQGEFTLADRLTLIPGVRLDLGQRSPSAASIAQGATEADTSAGSAKVQALYEVSDSLGLFGTWAQTERMPTLDELYSYGTSRAGAVQVPSLDLQNESAETFELGLTWQGQDLISEGDSLQVKATAFHNDLDNLIAANSTGATGSTAFVNISHARTWGAEIEAAYDAERWFANLAYAHVKSRNLTTGTSYGTTLADTPAENLALTLGAKLPAQGLTLGWRVNGHADITTASATTSGPGYATHDLFVTWTAEEGPLEGIDVSLTVENVFDRAWRDNLALDSGEGLNAKLTIGKTFTW